MASYRDKLPNYSGTPSAKPAADPTGAVVDWAEGFATSAFSSVPELFGINPLDSATKFRQDNPIAGFISELIGFGVPYAGWYKASKAIAPLERTIAKIGDLEKHPFVTGAARETVRYLPFEVGRLGASQVVGDEDFGTMFGDVALSLAAAGGIGGVFSGLASAGNRAARHAVIPGVDIGLPIQLQMRQLADMLVDPVTDKGLIPKIGYKLAELRRVARAETLDEGMKYVAPLEGDTDGSLYKGLNRLFRNKAGATVLQRRFAETSGDFKKAADWQAEASAAGLPEGFEPMGQYFRHISFNPKGKNVKGKASEIEHTLTRKMEDVGNGWFMAHEADNGLFILAKKFGGTVGKADPSDKWILFKTDRPGQFAKGAEKWNNSLAKISSWNQAGEIAADGGDVYNVAAGFVKHFPLHNYTTLSQPGMIEKLLPKNVRGPMNEAVARLGDAMREYLAPAVHQFKKSPRANWVWNAARATYDSADTVAQRLLYGTQKANPTKSIFAQAMRNKYDVDQTGSIKQILDPLSDGDISGLHYIWRRAINPANYDGLVTSGLVSPRAVEAARALNAIDEALWTNLVKAQKAAGDKVIPGMKGHLGLSRSWEGDARVAIRDEAGSIIAVASGYNRKHALKVAQEIADENPTWQIAEEFNVSDMRAVPKDLVPIVGSPGFVKERKNVRGFRWDKEPWTKEELMEAYNKAITARTKYQATLSVKHILQPHVDQVAKEDVVTHRMLAARLDDLAGTQSVFSQVQNQMADKILGPLLGSNSASKIVGLTNTAMWHLQLGGLKLSYPIVNALTFIQTVMPEVAYLMSAAPESLAGRYSYFAAGGTKGPVGGIGVLSPFKVMAASAREMRKPGKDLTDAFSRAQHERVIDPRLVEEYIGESATKLSDLRGAISSGSGFVGWLRSLSEFLPANSERLSRAHAFTSGFVVGRDHMKLEGENLYRFAKQFTENTMYMYQAADRPRVFTTPLGSSLGLFKNWMMNYIATMLEYTGEGLVKGNWAPLLWQTSGTAALGGLAATPIALAAGAFSEAFLNKDLLQAAYDDYGGGDAMMFGLPAALTGISMYSQTASPLANPVRDANMLFGVATFDRVKQIGSSVGQAFDHWQATGEHPGRDPRTRDTLIRAFAPVTLYRTMSVLEDEQIKSLASGYPVMKDVSLTDRVLYAAGFNPTAYEREMAVASRLFEKQAERQSAVAKLGEAWANAQGNKDGEELRRILRQAVVWGVDTGSVIKSGMARLAKRREDTIARSFRPQDIAEYDPVLSP